MLVEAAAIAGPLAVFLGAKALLAPDPAGARAQPAIAASAGGTEPNTGPKLTAEQERALAWIRSMPQADLHSPMLHPPASRALQTADPSPEPDAAPNVVSGLKLVGVLGNGENAIATIGGRVYRIGDEVRPGIKLKSVDARAGAAELEMSDGSVVRLIREHK